MLMVAVFNVSIFMYSLNASGGYTPAVPNVSSRIKTHDDLQLDEYVKVMDTNALLKDSCKYNNEDVLRKVIKKLTKDNEPRLLEKLKKDTRIKYQEQVFADIKEKLKADFTKKVFKQEQISNSLNAQLKNEFFNSHGDVIKSYIIKDLMIALKRMDKFSEFLKNDKNADTFVNSLIDLLNERPDRDDFFKFIYEELMIPFDPKVTIQPNYLGQAITPQRFNNPTKGEIFSHDYLLHNRVSLNKEQMDKLVTNHDNLVPLINNFNIPSNIVYTGDGYVVNGMGQYIGSALTTILQLHELGTNLPIELMILSKKDRDDYVCDELLPKSLNGRCVVIEEEAPFFLKKLPKSLTRSQLKILAIMFSTFDNVIVVETTSGTLPIRNLDSLLTSQDFLSTKFLIWPDIWAKTTSPLYYDIARIQPGEPIRRHGLLNQEKFSKYSVGDKKSDVLYHDLEGLPSGRTADSSLYVISKTSHFKPLLLALYYNFYGPSCYYKLLSQDSSSDNHKDTMIPALHVFGETYHIVEKDPEILETRISSELNGDNKKTLVHYFPTAAKFHMKDWKKWLTEKGLDSRLWPYQDNEYTKGLVQKFTAFKSKMTDVNDPILDGNKLEPMFLHLEKPLNNPLTIYEDGNSEIFETRNLGAFTNVKSALSTEIDVELKMAAINKWLVCDEKGLKKSKVLELNEMNQRELCEKAKKYVEVLKSDSEAPESDQLMAIESLTKESNQEETEEEQQQNKEAQNAKGDTIKDAVG